MEIDVIGVAPISGQLELSYAGLWARGYESQRGFVVLAGSEVRTDINPTAWDWIDEDRSKLRAAGALMAIDWDIANFHNRFVGGDIADALSSLTEMTRTAIWKFTTFKYD